MAPPSASTGNGRNDGFVTKLNSGLVAYGVTGSSAVRYRTWSSGGGWSEEQNGPNIGAVPNTMTLDADPFSDSVMLSARDAASDLNYVAWSGSAWGTVGEQETNTGETKYQPFVFVWDATRRHITITGSRHQTSASAAYVSGAKPSHWTVELE